MSATVSTRKRVVLRLTDEKRDELWSAISVYAGARGHVLDLLYPRVARARARAQAKADLAAALV